MIDDFRAAGNRGSFNGNNTGPIQTPPQPTVNPQPVPPAPQAPAMPAVQAAPVATQPAHALPKVPIARKTLTTTDAAPTAEQQGASEYLASLANDGQQPAGRRGISKRQWLILGSIIVVAIAGGISYVLTQPAAVANVNVVVKPKPKPVVVDTPVSPLTGLDVSAEDSKRIVTGVMIENTVFARPQSGLIHAGMVFEAIAEAGITRYLALFQEGQPGNIGPVRSARPYYVDWAHSFDAPIAHVGGSPDALLKIRREGIKDLDQFYNSGAYRRVNSREAPHNVYTTISQLNQVEAAKGWTTSSFTGFPRKRSSEVKLPDLSKLPPASVANTINISISGPTYNVRYQYDKASNKYLRFLAGEPHIDAETHNQLAPNVVVALVTPYGLEADGYHSKYQITGEGKAFVFQEGTVTQIAWSRPVNSGQYIFTGLDGKPFKFDPGQTWVTVVGDASAVNAKP